MRLPPWILRVIDAASRLRQTTSMLSPVERDFTDLAERYYLTLSSDPKVRVTRDAITVTIPIQNVE